MNRLVRILTLFLTVCIFSCTSAPIKKEATQKTIEEPSKSPKTLAKGDTIPDFTLPDVTTGEKISFEKDIKGKNKIIAITFFTPSCLSCKAEMGILSELAEKYGDDIKIYAIKEIFKIDDKGLPAISSNKINFLLDDNLSLLMGFGFGYAPSLVIANRDGKVLFVKEGYSPKDNYYITKAIKEAVETEK